MARWRFFHPRLHFAKHEVGDLFHKWNFRHGQKDKDDQFRRKEVDDKLIANSNADQKYAKDYADQLIAGLDATVTQTAGADGLALSITETDGKLTAISGSIAANTYDAYGAAAAAESAAKSYAEQKASAAESAAKSHAETKAGEAQAAAEQTAASALATARTEITAEIATAKSGAETTAATALATARTEITAEIATAKSGAETTAANALSAARTEITAEISKAIADSATAEGGVIANVIDKADAAQEAADAAQKTADDAVTEAEAAQIAAAAAQKTLDDFLTGEGVKETVDTLKDIQAELERLGEAVELEAQFAAKADKVTGATNGNIAGLDANGNLTDSGIAASTVATKSEVSEVDKKFANYTTTSALTELLAGKEAAGAAATAKSEAIAAAAEDATSKANAAESAAKTHADNKVKALADGAVAKNTGDISTINALLATYGNIVTHNVAEFATAAQGATADTVAQTIAAYGDIVSHNASEFATSAQGTKADSALQEITTTANGGLKVTNKNQIDIDTSVTFVFNCGNAEGQPLV